MYLSQSKMQRFQKWFHDDKKETKTEKEEQEEDDDDHDDQASFSLFPGYSWNVRHTS